MQRQCQTGLLQLRVCALPRTCTAAWRGRVGGATGRCCLRPKPPQPEGEGEANSNIQLVDEHLHKMSSLDCYFVVIFVAHYVLNQRPPQWQSPSAEQRCFGFAKSIGSR
jgi:hypothetical protein